jgi:hypothetical protein
MVMTTPHRALDDGELDRMRTILRDAVEANVAQQPGFPPGAEADAHRAARASLEQALQRVDDGTYGTCTGCGTIIPAARLELVPDAERCVSCAQRPPRLLS